MSHKRITNRHFEHKPVEPLVHYVDRIIEPKSVEPLIHYVDRMIEVEKQIEVPMPMDTSSIKEWTEHRLDALNVDIMLVHHDHKEHTNQRFDSIKTALDMQSRALVALKTQRDVDRSRRLMLIKRMKKEHDAHNQIALKLKLAIGASLVLSLLVLIIK